MPPTSKRPIVLIDIMETLVTEPFHSVMPRFFGMSLEELLEQKHPTTWVEFERGEISEEEYFTRFFADRRTIDGPQLRRAIAEAYEWLEGMEAIVAELHAAGYQLHALSNYPVWYRLIEERLELSRYLHWSFVSCHTGVRKPDEAAYLEPARELGVAPSECLFIDDRPRNIEAARSLGLDTILKQDAAQVRRELGERELLRGP